MARSVNKAIILGNLGKEPELRSTPAGTAVCSFSVATTESYKEKNGEWKEQTEWHNIVCWNYLAETAHKSLKKGSKVYIEGKITNRSYEGKDGVTRYISEIVASTLVPLDGKNTFSDNASEPSSSYGQSAYGDLNAVDQGGADDDIPF